MKLTIMLSLLLSFKPAVGSDRMLDTLGPMKPDARIRYIANHIDRLAELKTSRENLAAWFGKINAAARTLDDKNLEAITAYWHRVQDTFFESDISGRKAIYSSAMAEYQRAGDRRFEAVCLHYLGQELFIEGQYAEAFNALLKAQRVFRAVGFEKIPEIGKYLHDLALNHYFFRDIEKVIDLMHESLQHPPYSRNLDMQRYNTLALAHKHIGNLDSATYYLRKTIAVAERYRDSVWISLAAGNLGGIYLKQGRYAEALPLLQQDFDYNKGNSEHPEMARNAAVALAETWLGLGETEKTLQYLQESKRFEYADNQDRFGRQQREEEYLRYYYDVFHQYHRVLGNTPYAYLYLDSLTRISSEINQRYNTMITQVAENRLQIQSQLVEIESANQQKKVLTSRMVLISLALFLLVAVFALLFYFNKLKLGREKAIAALKQQQLQAEQDGVRAELRQAKRKLQHYLTHLKEKNSLVKKVTAELATVKATQDTAAIQNALHNLTDARLLTHKDWVVFRRKFNTVFDHELDTLKREYPDITPAEERIYALTKLEIGTKEMADMLGISPESVRKARYRLRKKLDESTTPRYDENLYENK